jgi:ElaA protein
VIEISWLSRPFEALNPEALYALMRLRQEVFVVEQDCAYLDADGLDAPAIHLLGMTQSGASPAAATPEPAIQATASELVAYARILPPGTPYVEPSIGRIVTAPAVRGTGLGIALMEESIARTEALYGPLPIRIMAQTYLDRFYRRFGFMAAGEEFLEDGIPHVEMLRNPDC